MPTPNRGAEDAKWRAQKIIEEEYGVLEEVSHHQPRMGSGERREVPRGWAEPRPETHFGVFRRPQNAPICIYRYM